MDSEITKLENEIQEKCSELNDIASIVSKLPEVTHLSQSRIQWVGGIIGAIQENREAKRLEQLINQVIYKDLSFYKLAFHIVEMTDDLSETHKKLQTLIGKDDDRYYGLAENIFQSVDICIRAWYNYSPDMALASIDIDGEKDVALYPSVKMATKESMAKMDLPEKLAKLTTISMDDMDPNGGCLSVVILMIVSSVCIIGGISYCITQFV